MDGRPLSTLIALVNSYFDGLRGKKCNDMEERSQGHAEHGLHTKLGTMVQAQSLASTSYSNQRLQRKYYLLRLNPGSRREKDQLGSDELGMFILDYSSVKFTHCA